MSDTSTTTTGVTGAGGGSMLRITGMATGLDVDAMVKKMLTAEQTKLDKAKQQQQTIQWKQEAYQSIIKDIKDWQSSFFDTSSSDKNILSSTNFSPFTVSSTNGSSTVDTSVATFTPGVGAQAGQYSITVRQLAAGAGLSNTLANKSLSTKLTDLGFSGDVSLKLSVNGSATPTEIKLTTTANSTLGDLVNAINNQGFGSIKASYSELTGEFKLNTTTTGSSTSLKILSGTSAAFSNVLGVGTDADTDGQFDSDVVLSAGVNADVTITTPSGSKTLNDANGNAKTTNNFTIDGMTYTLSSVSPKDATDNTKYVSTSVNVGSDTTKVYDKIKSFIDKYNTIVDEIQTKLTEKKDSNYPPLTDSQKSSMSDSQITAWETKAKVGVLRNDDNLSKLLNDLRTAFTTAVSNTGLSIGNYGSNSIGIDTSSDYTTPGHVDISDPSKLKAAISSNSDQILKMFTNVSAATDGGTNYTSSTQEYSEDGIFTRIKNILQTNVGYTNTTLNTAILTSYANKQYDYSFTGSGGKGTIPDQLYEQQLMVKKITSEMSDKQEQYYKQFSALETAMTTLNAQQAQLSSLIG